MSADENIVLMFSFETRALHVCWETELLTGAKIPWILFTVYVAAAENGIQSQIETEPLEWRSGKKSQGGVGKAEHIAGLTPGVGLEG